MGADGGLVDAETAATIRNLEQEKHLAINMENFDLAKELKVQIDSLKAIGVKLKTLEHQKQEAVASENFDMASQINQQMKALRVSALGRNEAQGQQSSGNIGQPNRT